MSESRESNVTPLRPPSSESERPEPANDSWKAPADSALPNWLTSLPGTIRPYAALARWDRPVGVWLVLLPAWAGLFYTRIPFGPRWIDIFWMALFALGAIAIRGAGCTWNDITDRDIDAKVARTASRPIPAGDVQLWQAWLFLDAQLLVGVLCWLFLPVDAKIVALFAVPLIGLYPFMKRITWWPQAWLGLCMNWGFLVGAATAIHVSYATLIFYAGLICWTIAYDTIYALQDREDDALIGVRSTARLFGSHALSASFAFQIAAAALIAIAASVAYAERAGAITALAFLTHCFWQQQRLRDSREGDALAVFKSNVWAGAILVVGFMAASLI